MKIGFPLAEKKVNAQKEREGEKRFYENRFPSRIEKSKHSKSTFHVKHF